MLQQVEAIFADMGPMLKGLKKKTYEANMKAFREKKMARQIIPRITPDMLKNLPDQACDILNRVIDKINDL